MPVICKPMSVNRLEWEHIERVLRKHKSNISETARALSMHRRTLQRKLAEDTCKTPTHGHSSGAVWAIPL